MTGYRTGAATRRKILEALLAREPRTIRGLALAIGQHNHGVHQQVHRMQRDGLVVITPGRGRQGSSVMLTAAGRAMASDLKTLGDQEADTL